MKRHISKALLVALFASTLPLSAMKTAADKTPAASEQSPLKTFWSSLNTKEQVVVGVTTAVVGGFLGILGYKAFKGLFGSITQGIWTAAACATLASGCTSLAENYVGLKTKIEKDPKKEKRSWFAEIQKDASDAFQGAFGWVKGLFGGC